MNVKKVLVVDDSPTELKLMSEPFVQNGYGVVTATDGQQALQMAADERPALIILDVIMPKLNGFQVCRKIKTQDALKEIKVIMLTSKNQESDKFWGEKQGADAYMTKPFDSQELLNMARSLMG